MAGLHDKTSSTKHRLQKYRQTIIDRQVKKKHRQYISPTDKNLDDKTSPAKTSTTKSPQQKPRQRKPH